MGHDLEIQRGRYDKVSDRGYMHEVIARSLRGHRERDDSELPSYNLGSVRL